MWNCKLNLARHGWNMSMRVKMIVEVAARSLFIDPTKRGPLAR